MPGQIGKSSPLPFLLFAGSGPFLNFSLLVKDGQPSLAYQIIQTFAVTGLPLIEDYSTPTPTVTPRPAPAAAILGTEITANQLGLWQKLLTFH